MNAGVKPPVMEAIIERAGAEGADLAGITAVSALRAAPSYRVEAAGIWPDDARSVLVLGLVHKEDRPELDWWTAHPRTGKGDTEGNRLMRRMVDRLAAWLEREFGRRAVPPPYHVENGGVYLKDAAVLAGLGAVGENNLFMAPDVGPRVRLRALFLDFDVETTGAAAIDLCSGCSRPCLAVCPRGAFPGGRYNRADCQVEMNRNVEDAGDGPIRYCRACELACPIGR